MKNEKTQTLEEANGQVIREELEALEKEEAMKEESARLWKEQVQAREDAELAAEEIDTVPDPLDDQDTIGDGIEDQDDDIIDDDDIISEEDWNAMTDEEKAEYEQTSNVDEEDPEYLKTSPEVVGFDNRRQQMDMYDVACEDIGPKESVLDFGCGRGDLYDFLYRRNGDEPKYKGIDINEHLINAGVEKYAPNINIECKNWNEIKDTDKSNWCVNIGSLCARYDGTDKEDSDIVKETMDKMMTLCTSGCSLILFSSYMPDEVKEDEFLVTDPTDIFDYAMKKYGRDSGNVALDHTFSDSAYKITILKQQ